MLVLAVLCLSVSSHATVCMYIYGLCLGSLCRDCALGRSRGRRVSFKSSGRVECSSKTATNGSRVLCQLMTYCKYPCSQQKTQREKGRELAFCGTSRRQDDAVRVTWGAMPVHHVQYKGCQKVRYVPYTSTRYHSPACPSTCTHYGVRQTTMRPPSPTCHPRRGSLSFPRHSAESAQRPCPPWRESRCMSLHQHPRESTRLRVTF